ncbi:MAG TPA: adenylosuccinate lyase, partial [Acidimicrobiales bacterium]|nr:adenylosuccinate lyase [Acidimicrobiales bacterium]
LALIESGVERDAAYRIVQANAMRAWEERTPFRSLLEADPEVSARVGPEALDEAFSLARSLRNAGRVFDALEEIE